MAVCTVEWSPASTSHLPVGMLGLQICATMSDLYMGSGVQTQVSILELQVF